MGIDSMMTLLARQGSGAVVRQDDADAADALVPLEDLLVNDPHGFALKRVKDELVEIRAKVLRRAQGHMTPADYRRHAALADAVGTAIEVVDAVWAEQNEGGRSWSPRS